MCHYDGQDSVFYRPDAVRKIFLSLGSMLSVFPEACQIPKLWPHGLLTSWGHLSSLFRGSESPQAGHTWGIVGMAMPSEGGGHAGKAW